MELILALASLPYAAKVRFAAVSLIRLMTGRGRLQPVVGAAPLEGLRR